MKSVYVAGPMTGYPEFNFPAFHKAAKSLRKQGWNVHNPAEKDMESELHGTAVKTGNAALAIKKGFDFREAFLWDTARVIEGDGIYMLKGWEQSPGARAEHAVATVIKKSYPDYKIMYEGVKE